MNCLVSTHETFWWNRRVTKTHRCCCTVFPLPVHPAWKIRIEKHGSFLQIMWNHHEIALIQGSLLSCLHLNKCVSDFFPVHTNQTWSKPKSLPNSIFEQFPKITNSRPKQGCTWEAYIYKFLKMICHKNDTNLTSNQCERKLPLIKSSLHQFLHFLRHHPICTKNYWLQNFAFTNAKVQTWQISSSCIILDPKRTTRSKFEPCLHQESDVHMFLTGGLFWLVIVPESNLALCNLELWPTCQITQQIPNALLRNLSWGSKSPNHWRKKESWMRIVSFFLQIHLWPELLTFGCRSPGKHDKKNWQELFDFSCEIFPVYHKMHAGFWGWLDSWVDNIVNLGFQARYQGWQGVSTENTD